MTCLNPFLVRVRLNVSPDPWLKQHKTGHPMSLRNFLLHSFQAFVSGCYLCLPFQVNRT